MWTWFVVCVCVCVCVGGGGLQNAKYIGKSLVFFSHVSEHDVIEKGPAFTEQKGKVLHIVQPT